MSKIVFIKNNSKEIRDKLKQSGFSVCICASFEDSIWLDYHPEEKMSYDIHGVGFCDKGDPEENMSPIERIEEWLKLDWYFCKEREFYDDIDDFLKHYKKL